MAVMDDIAGPGTVITSIKKNMDSKKNIRNQRRRDGLMYR